MKFALCFALIGVAQAAVGDDCAANGQADCGEGEYCDAGSLCAT